MIKQTYTNSSTITVVFNTYLLCIHYSTNLIEIYQHKIIQPNSFIIV